MKERPSEFISVFAEGPGRPIVFADVQGNRLLVGAFIRLEKIIGQVES